MLKACPHPVFKACLHPVLKACSHPLFKACPHLVFKACPHRVLKACPHPVFKACPHRVFKACLHRVLKACSQPLFKACPHPVFKACPHPLFKACPHRVLKAYPHGTWSAGYFLRWSLLLPQPSYPTNIKPFIHGNRCLPVYLNTAAASVGVLGVRAPQQIQVGMSDVPSILICFVTCNWFLNCTNWCIQVVLSVYINSHSPDAFTSQALKAFIGRALRYPRPSSRG